jgi:hypothetical protein
MDAQVGRVAVLLTMELPGLVLQVKETLEVLASVVVHLIRAVLVAAQALRELLFQTELWVVTAAQGCVAQLQGQEFFMPEVVAVRLEKQAHWLTPALAVLVVAVLVDHMATPQLIVTQVFLV